MSPEPLAQRRRLSLGFLCLTLPVFIFYLLTPSLNTWWRSFISVTSNPYAGELARAAISETSWAKSVRQRHNWMEKNNDYDHILCPWDLQRISRLGDGGKWICGMSKYESLQRPLRVYSFGVGGDSSFEAEMLNRSSSAEVWGFDDSVDGWGSDLETGFPNRTHFFKTAVAGYDFYDESDKIEFLSIESIMSKLGHDYVDIIKMDIEGDEFPTIESFFKDFERGEKYEGKEVPVGQLVIEIHVPDKGPRITQFAEWWERLERSGMRPAMSEANYLAVTVGDGKPCCVEVSLAVSFFIPSRFLTSIVHLDQHERQPECFMDTKRAFLRSYWLMLLGAALIIVSCIAKSTFFWTNVWTT
ncbi:hypothetical protein C8034_v003520 [Colletotrichum sidae]|uniref:Methyltransferase domain-containing protein n=1 Tax=Colletotrichum sidae TaxID=1347389 RepID=A0A4R8TBJ4_9PEZI|nr:hypothetical protein C8034_v003520 [Colletotrichum sidae]